MLGINAKVRNADSGSIFLSLADEFAKPAACRKLEEASETVGKHGREELISAIEH